MNEEDGNVHVIFRSSQIVIDLFVSEQGEEYETTEDLEENSDGHRGTYRRTEFKENVFWEFLSEGYVWIPLTKEHDKDLLMELNLAFDLALSSMGGAMQINYN